MGGEPSLLKRSVIILMTSQYDFYNPKGPILLLALDSFHKRKDGTVDYNDNSSLFSSGLEQKNLNLLVSTRKKIFNHLKLGEVVWDGCEVEREYNDNLILDKDFFVKNNQAKFLPAIDRYDGDFYDGIGEKGKDYLAHSKHHFLILSALYGFLKPFEPIQFYSCQFGDKNLCYDLWTNQNGISNILIDYMKKNNIKKTFDFTACDVIAYHQCIDWEYVIKATNSEIIHAYHSKTTTDKGLKYFGRFVRDQMLLRTSEDLLKIASGSMIDEIEFSDKIKCINQKTTVEDTFKKLITNSEHEFVEYKSSALWSKLYTQQQIQESKERDVIKYGRNLSKFIIAKTVAGFLNTDGGNLIIGISENKNNLQDEIIGIESEYSKLEDPCPDGYRRMIVDDIIKYFFSPDIFNNFTKYIGISFQNVENKTLCWLQIKKSDIPVFVNINREDCFYIRVDAETRQIIGKPMSDYILKRFK